MSSVLASPLRPTAAAIQYFSWSYPEWWSVALCWFAWAVMVLHGWRYAAHGIHHRMSFEQELPYWMWMVAAMMLPLALDALRVTAARSLWGRRHRAIAGFLAGYFAPWLILGISAAALREASWTHTYAAAALGFVAAALRQRTPMHRRAVIACHRTHPLAPLGWRADLDCLRFGGMIGGACVRSCWPMMVACVFTGHSLIAMVGGMAVGAVERWPLRPRTRAMLVGTLALASYYGLVAILEYVLAFALHNQPAP